jgi:hypothetical protein
VTVGSSGSILTQGSDGDAIVVRAEQAQARISGLVETQGNNADGVYVVGIGNGTPYSADIVTYAGSAIYTDGALSRGIHVSGANASTVDISVSGAIETGRNYAGGASDSYSHGIFVDTAGEATIALTDTGSIATHGGAAHGIYVNNAVEDVSVTANGAISTDGVQSYGIKVRGSLGNVTVTGSGTINTLGSLGAGMYAEGDAVSYAMSIVDASRHVVVMTDGPVATQGEGSHAINVGDIDGNLMIASSDAISTFGAGSHGINVFGTLGSATISAQGAIQTNGDQSYGVHVADAAGYVLVLSTAPISTFGDIAHAVRVETAGTAYVGVNAVETSGDAAVGVFISADDASTSIGTVRTLGDNATGISIAAEHARAEIRRTVETQGDSADGLYVGGPSGGTLSSADIVTYAGSAIHTNGAESHGIHIRGEGASLVHIAGLVTANGSDAHALTVSGSYVGAEVTISASVHGGGGTGAGISLANPGAASSAVTIESMGALGALSDLALKSEEAVALLSSGTITGVVSLGGGNDAFTNAGQWNLRNFADTDGDGIRDAEGLARADFGGGDDWLVNTGTISLIKGSSNPVQGEIANLETFDNSGTIDLQDGIAGDRLSIAGDFISNGGSLLLDAQLAGAQMADVLSLKTVTLANAGGLGARTSGNGILIIDADSDTSNGAAFSLADTVTAGPYEYQLHYDNAAIAWYLQATRVFASSVEYPALVTGALLGFASDLSALHNRIGEARLRDGADERIEPAAWTGGGLKWRPWLHAQGASQEIGAAVNFHQQVEKIEAGLDGRFELNGVGNAIIGAFGGRGNTAQDFKDATVQSETTMALAGIYAGYSMGGAYGNAVLKYEHHWSDYLSSTASDGTSYAIDLLGLSLEKGIRFAVDEAYLQPRARVNYAHAWSSSFKDDLGDIIDLKNARSLAAEVAARIGYQSSGLDVRIDAGLRHEFLEETEAKVSGQTFSDQLPGNVAFISGGMGFGLLEEKMLLGLEAQYSKGEDAEEAMATASFRLLY